MAITYCTGKVNEKGQELLEHGTPLFPVGCYFDNLSEEDVPWHWHEELELFLVAEGAAEVWAGQEHYQLKTGEGCFVNSGILHAAKNQEGICRFHSLVFHPRLVGGSADSIYWQEYLNPLMKGSSLAGLHLKEKVGWQKEILDTLEAAWQGIARETPGFEFEVRARLSAVIYRLSCHYPGEKGGLSVKALRDEERMKQMLQFIQEHCGEELTLEQIADSASVSTSECLRCFRNTIGSTPMAYVNQYRIQRAASLLSDTTRKIADIGETCGFQDMSYFARSFRKSRGCTPSEYRRRKQQNSSGQGGTEMVQ